MLTSQPFLVALITLAAWLWLVKKDIHFPKADEGVLTTAVIATLAIAFSIFATAVLSAIWEKYRKVVVAVLERDEHTFLLYRDERIPIILHLLLAFLSLPLIVVVMLLEYHSLWSGGVSVSLVTFVVSIYWVVVVQLEDPAKSPWFAERIPLKWLLEDVDTYFKLERAGHHPT